MDGVECAGARVEERVDEARGAAPEDVRIGAGGEEPLEDERAVLRRRAEAVLVLPETVDGARQQRPRQRGVAVRLQHRTIERDVALLEAARELRALGRHAVDPRVDQRRSHVVASSSGRRRRAAARPERIAAAMTLPYSGVCSLLRPAMPTGSVNMSSARMKISGQM